MLIPTDVKPDRLWFIYRLILQIQESLEKILEVYMINKMPSQ